MAGECDVYGHVNQYLDTQALRLRAERAERLAKMWRLTGLAFGLALVCLLAVVVWQERQLAETTASLADQRELNFELGRTNEVLEEDLQDLHKQLTALEAFWTATLEADGDAQKLFEEQEREVYVALQRAVDAEEAAEAEKRSFAVCKSANAGLVDALQEFDQLVKDQKALIVESIELAKRCDVSPITWAETPTTWASAWQVVGDAR
jgi:hypothetical protein